MNNWRELVELLSQLPVLENLNVLKQQMDDIRPLPSDVEGRVMQKLRLEWNYHSNAIEGNKLTYGETYSFLMYGLTAKGKPFKDHLDIKGHNDAIQFLTSLVKDDNDLTEVDIRNLHKMILVEPYQSPAQTPDGQATTKTIRIGEYKQQPNHVKTPTGEIHYFATVEETPIKMYELAQWYNEARRNPKIHPSVLAAFVHHRFVNIHPFDDGNGRLARILMNLILMKNGYPPAIVKLKERTDYYQALNQADRNEYTPLIEFIAEAVSDSLSLYLKAAKGESIEDDGDLDKEIALFKGSFERTYTLRSFEIEKDIVYKVLLPIYDRAIPKLKEFDELFDKKDTRIHFSDLKILERTTLNQTYVNQSHSKITAFYDWKNFKKSKNSFYLNSSIKLSFYDTAYEIELENQVIVSKLYDEVVTELEKQEVANKWVRSVFENLKKKIEEANKS
ncbi:MAG: Fic family protein [Saprospiraceae bacterium]|nr:Fic family protein [Saprospiraceae bacterium]